MEIEVEQLTSLRKDIPGMVHVKMIDNSKNLRGTVVVYPMFENDQFRVEVNQGGLLGPIDIKVVV